MKTYTAYDPNLKLMDQVTNLLIVNQYPEPSNWETLLHPDAFTTTDVNVERFLINRVWRELIGRYPEDTMDIRFCLVDQGRIEDWFRLFEQGVLPCILRNAPHKNNS